MASVYCHKKNVLNKIGEISLDVRVDLLMIQQLGSSEIIFTSLEGAFNDILKLLLPIICKRKVTRFCLPNLIDR